MEDHQDHEFPKNYAIRCRIDNMKIPPDKWYIGKKSVSLSFDVTPRLKTDEYGRTHSISIYDPVSGSKIYIGEGTIKVFETGSVDKTKLPPVVPGQMQAESPDPDPLISDAQVIQDEEPMDPPVEHNDGRS